MAAEADVRAGIQALRRVAHDELLTELSADGLAAALATLTARKGAELRVEPAELSLLSAPVERAAYLLVRAGLAGGEADEVPATVRVAASGGALLIEVHGSPLADLTEVTDWVGATRGALELADDGTLVGRWPCESS